jgi:hypothetical protein
VWVIFGSKIILIQQSSAELILSLSWYGLIYHYNHLFGEEMLQMDKLKARYSKRSQYVLDGEWLSLEVAPRPQQAKYCSRLLRVAVCRVWTIKALY